MLSSDYTKEAYMAYGELLNYTQLESEYEQYVNACCESSIAMMRRRLEYLEDLLDDCPDDEIFCIKLEIEDLKEWINDFYGYKK